MTTIMQLFIRLLALATAVHGAFVDDQCFACIKPTVCIGLTCNIVGGCGLGVPVGYYPDLTNSNSYCYCTGTNAPSRYETCYPSSLNWDTHQQGNNYYLAGNYGNDGLWGTNGGGCSWDWQVSRKGKQRPGINGNAIVTDFSINPNGDVCGTPATALPTDVSPTTVAVAAAAQTTPEQIPNQITAAQTIAAPQGCEDNLGFTVANTLDKNTWPTLTAGFPLYRDDGVNVMVAGDFTSRSGAELEGASITLGDFHVQGSGLSNVGVVGAGSQVVPNNGRDSWIVGGDLILDRTVQYMSGNILIGGEKKGLGSIGSIGSGRTQEGANINIDEYQTMFAELKIKADYWANLSANGVWGLQNGNTLEFKAGNNDLLQVFRIPESDLNYIWGINVKFDSSLQDKTILINVDSNANKNVVVKNLANFFDPDDNNHWAFKTKYSANILWNFHDATTVDIGGGASGNGEFTGSIIVPTPGCMVTMRFPGSSGRFIVNGDAIQDNGGHEFHNFPFQPPTPLPLPDECNAAEAPRAASLPTALPTTSPTALPTVSTAPPTVEPTVTPTVEPTVTPTVEPTVTPTAELTESPTAKLTASPTTKPTLSPTTKPTLSPTTKPTLSPTTKPTLSPTDKTTVSPTKLPTPKATDPQTLDPTPQPAPAQSGPPSKYDAGGVQTLSPSARPLQNSGASGDPHFKTWSGQRYDFHGICDLILLSNSKFNNNLGMVIYIRSKKTKQWSYISTAVIRIGVETFEVSGRTDGDTHWINGIEGDGSGGDIFWEEGTSIAGFPITYKRVHSIQREYVIHLGDNSEKIVFKTWKDFVRVDVVNPREEDFTGSLGLMGSYPEGNIVGRSNPSSSMKDMNAFGQEWQVQSSDPQLFHSVEGPQYPSLCKLPSKSSLRRRLSKSEISREGAEILCSDISTKEELDLCIFDVMATSDPGIASAY